MICLMTIACMKQMDVDGNDSDLLDDCPVDPMDVDWNNSDFSGDHPNDPMDVDWVDSDLLDYSEDEDYLIAIVTWYIEHM